MKDIFSIWIAFSVISASFWLVVFLLGFVALAVYGALKESVGYWFLVLYKASLAIFFASVMVVPVILMRQYGYSWWWYIFSFIFFYFSLSKAYYTDQSDAGVLGFTIGLASFPVFSIFHDLAFNMVTQKFFQAISWLINSWIGILIGIYVLYKLGSYILSAGCVGVGLLLAGIWGIKERVKNLMSGKKDGATTYAFEDDKKFTGNNISESEELFNKKWQETPVVDPPEAEEQIAENSIDEITEEINTKREIIADLSEEASILKNELAIFEAEYHGRIGVLYVKLDELELAIKEYLKRIELLKSEKIKNLVDLEKEIEEQFKTDYQKIKEEKEEAEQYSEEYERVKEKPKLDEESEKRLKSLYRELAKKYHPDMARTPEDKEKFHKIMAEINQAYNDRDLKKMEELAIRLKYPEKIFVKESLEEEFERLLRESEKLDEIISDIENELDAIRNSDTFKFKINVDEAGAEGKDLLKEMEDGLKTKIGQKETELEKVKQEFKDIAEDLA